MANGIPIEDPDRPIESYPGYLGYYFDGTYQLEAALSPLEEFDWSAYRDFDPPYEQPRNRTITIVLKGKRRRISFEREMIDLISFLDLLPTVRVTYDIADGSEGPASSGALAVWGQNGYSLVEISDSAQQCLDALEKDFHSLRQVE